MVASGTQDRTKTRMLSVEILRIVAMLGIAVFHTFQFWFESACSGQIIPESLLYRPPLLGTLGFIDQLGAWGNHVFIMISGCFLLPAAVRNAYIDQRKAGDAARRCLHILSVVIPYAVIAIVAGMVMPGVTSASLDSVGWFTQGLQFIWVYLALIVMCPYLGQLWVRLRHPERVLAGMTVIVYVLNIYIAFVSPGDSWRSLFEWRKLMSAVTYGLSFIIGGWLAQRRFSFASSSMFLVASVLVTAAVEAYAAVPTNLGLLDALSYKSTSPWACAMAIGSLGLALSLSGNTGKKCPRLSRIVTTITSGMLGFYVLQALFSRGWHQISYDLLYHALKQQGQLAFVMAGVLFSAVLLTALLLVDIFVRQSLVSLLGRKD